MSTSPDEPQFDAFAQNYDSLLADSISASGESTTYFVDYKVACLKRFGVQSADPILDYGCGIGKLIEGLLPTFSDVHGFDPSSKSLDVAQQRLPQAHLHRDVTQIPTGHFAGAVLSCVLHHVPLEQRLSLLQTVREKLAPGGRLFIFEHNPWNPVTRRAVAACAFDHDAVLLWPGETKRLAQSAGFDRVTLDYIVFFPRPLAFLRPLEPHLGWLGLGAQTLTIGEKPRLG